MTAEQWVWVISGVAGAFVLLAVLVLRDVEDYPGEGDL